MKRLLLLFLMAGMCVSGLFATRLKVKEDANMREQPDKDSAIVMVVKHNVNLEGEEDTNNQNWYKVTYEGKTGYIHSSLLEKNEIEISETDAKGIVFIIVGIIVLVILVITLKIPVISGIITILLHVGRLIYVISALRRFGANPLENPGFELVILGFFTAGLTLYGIGQSAFDDTRRETGNVLLNPVEGGGFKLVNEVAGNSPLKTFGLSILWSGIVGFVVAFVLGLIATEHTTAMFVIVLVLSIIGMIRGVISLLKTLRII